MRLRRGPIGVILAGGQGRRIGGSKAIVKLRGRPLIVYALEAVASVLGEVAVIAKPDTELPSLSGVTVWIEPEAPQHPVVGIKHALALANGRPVFICAADLPLVTPALIERIAHDESSRGGGGRREPRGRDAAAAGLLSAGCRREAVRRG